MATRLFPNDFRKDLLTVGIDIQIARKWRDFDVDSIMVNLYKDIEQTISEEKRRIVSR